MDYKFLKNLSLSELNELKLVLSSSSNELLDEVLKHITYKEGLQQGVIDFSSDRMPYYRCENEGRCIELLDELTLDDVPFLRGAFSAREVNRMGSLLCSRISDELDDNFNLLTLDNFFLEPFAVFSYEGVYNTLNYIKNQIYYCLLNNSNVSKKELTQDMEYKKELTKKQLSDIARYI